MTESAAHLSIPPEPDADDICALPLVRRVAALLDRDPLEWHNGMDLPRGWEFILFTPYARQSTLGGDGHHLPAPELDDGSPAKVMLGGRRFTYAAPVPIGSKVLRTSEIARIETKEGRAGLLTVVTRRHRMHIADSGVLAIEEHEDMIYRAVTSGTARSAASGGKSGLSPKPAPFDAEQSYFPDETMLFRYSAVGNNTHRIHYDLAFATRNEGYPGLVVNGGLTSLMLVELFRSHVGREPASVATQMVRPLFCGSTNMLKIVADGDGYRVWSENAAGEVAARATIS